MNIYKVLRYISLNIPLRGMRRIVKFIADPNSDLDYEFTVPFYGNYYIGKLSDYIDWNVYFFGAYEKPLIDLIYSLFLDHEDDVIMLDIGANVGHHSLALSAIAHKVYSFEPYPPLCKRFNERIKQTEVSNISLHEFALGDEENTIDFFPPSTSNKGQGSFVRNDVESNLVQPVKLKTRIADDFISEINLENIHFIKIDVEGFEPQVLRGLNKTLKKNEPVLIVEKSQENNPSFINLDSLLSFLPKGYEIYYLSQQTSILVKYKLIKISESYFVEFCGNLICIPPKYNDSVLNSLLNKKF